MGRISGRFYFDGMNNVTIVDFPTRRAPSIISAVLPFLLFFHSNI